MDQAIQLNRICKRFGAVEANKNVSLTVRKGEIHGLVGENGSGKSTLMNILYGFHAPDSGSINIFDKPLAFGRPAEAIALGLGMVHQHFMLVETLSVLDNVMLGSEGGSLLGSGRAEMRKTLADFGQRYGLTLPADARVGDLPVGLKQRVEIIKALKGNTRVLILDEPTSVLTPQEVDSLFEILRTLKSEGVTVLLITHKLAEIMDITDRVSVMRRGELVADCPTCETDKATLAELMVGRQVKQVVRRLINESIDQSTNSPEHSGNGDSSYGLSHGPVCLEVEGLSCASEQQGLQDINLSLKSGEILGVAGVSGNGQTELLETLAGLRPLTSGVIRIHQNQAHQNQAKMTVEITANAPYSAAEIRALGVGHVPEDRHRRGMVLPFKAYENAVLGFLTKLSDRAENATKYISKAYSALLGQFLSPADMYQHCANLMERWDVRPANPNLEGQHFSGGNQQKLVMAREVEAGPQILLVGQPTRGVDIGAIESIHSELIQLRDAGCAILLVSVELDEILALSDRILVLHEGQQMGLIDSSAANSRSLGLMMAGIPA